MTGDREGSGSGIPGDGRHDKGRSLGNTPRWIVGILLLSLMTNMLVAGVVGGRILAHRHGHDDHRHGMRNFLDKLPQARREELGKLVKSWREAVHVGRRNIRQLRRDVRETMMREPFDKAAFDAALARMTSARLSVKEQSSADFAELVARMTADERKTFASQVLQKRKKHRRHDDES